MNTATCHHREDHAPSLIIKRDPGDEAVEELAGIVSGGGIYLYCIFEDPPEFGMFEGIDGRSETSAIGFRNIWALVSKVSLREIGEINPNRRPQDQGLKRLRSKVRRHGKVIRIVMEHHTVIPVRFGTVFSSGSEVRAVISRNYDEFLTFLDYVRDKEEWGLKVYASPQPGRYLGLTSNDRAREPDEPISRENLTNAYFLRKRREQYLHAESTRWRSMIPCDIYTRIATEAAACHCNPPLETSATGRTDEMILNAAFLVNKSKAASFRNALARMAEEYSEQGLEFVESGPWAPFNFCSDISI
jgi:hypothetical protein